jgi:hypothetical protein
MRVSCVAVFGSYLQVVDVLSDLDIGYYLEPKSRNSVEHDQLWQQQIHAEQAKGRRFRNMFDEMYWPNTKVLQALRGRAQSVSLESLDGISGQCPPISDTRSYTGTSNAVSKIIIAALRKHVTESKGRLAGGPI